jgi:hypothetical protein
MSVSAAQADIGELRANTVRCIEAVLGESWECAGASIKISAYIAGKLINRTWYGKVVEGQERPPCPEGVEPHIWLDNNGNQQIERSHLQYFRMVSSPVYEQLHLLDWIEAIAYAPDGRIIGIKSWRR